MYPFNALAKYTVVVRISFNSTAYTIHRVTEFISRKAFTGPAYKSYRKEFPLFYHVFSNVTIKSTWLHIIDQLKFKIIDSILSNN